MTLPTTEKTMPEWLLHSKVEDPRVYKPLGRRRYHALCSNVTRRYHLTADSEKVNCPVCIEMMAEKVAHKLGIRQTHVVRAGYRRT